MAPMFVVMIGVVAVLGVGGTELARRAILGRRLEHAADHLRPKFPSGDERAQSSEVDLRVHCSAGQSHHDVHVRPGGWRREPIDARRTRAERGEQGAKRAMPRAS